MRRKPYLLFDAGGTLTFVDLPAVIRAVDGLSVSVAEHELLTAHFRWVHAWDAGVREQGRLPSGEPRGYLDDMLDHLRIVGPDAGQILGAAQELYHQRNLWTFVPTVVRETLDTLRTQGYAMSVISNADGRVEAGLRDCSLIDYFERVFDSTIVGVAKPEPGIFELALDELGIEPSEALYIGDMYYNDVWGANRAGVGAVHLDPLRLYAGWPGVHIEGLHALPRWLNAYTAEPETYDVRAASNLRLGEE